MTPEDHPAAAWITFSVFGEDSRTVVHIQVLLRADDPIYELGFRLLGSRGEDRFWQDTLATLAAYFGVNAPVQVDKRCLDPKLQWAEARNIWQNAAIRAVLYRMLTPVPWTLKRVSH